ncbi:MAG: flagellar basal body P-ring formation chaperone FlgA [Planctomycetaceae bacterium]
MMDRQFTSPSRVRFVVFVIGSIIWAEVAPLIAGDSITVRLHERVHVSESIVRVRHVAEVSGSNMTAVDRARELDVMNLTEENAEQILTRELLQVRLLLAGFPLDAVTMNGAETVTVTLAAVSPYPSLDVEHAAAISMAGALGSPLEDVRVKLAAPLEMPQDTRTTGNQRISIDVLPPVRPTPGRVRLTVRLLVDGELRNTVSGLFDVRVRHTVVLASASLPTGTVLTADHLTVNDEWSDERPVHVDIGDLFDRQLRRSIPVGVPVGLRDLKPVTDAKSQPLIAVGDVVRLVVRQGNLTVIVPTAEALQSGLPGETIRVRNLESRKIVVGRVVSAREVEVRLQ